MVILPSAVVVMGLWAATYSTRALEQGWWPRWAPVVVGLLPSPLPALHPVREVHGATPPAR